MQVRELWNEYWKKLCNYWVSQLATTLVVGLATVLCLYLAGQYSSPSVTWTNAWAVFLACVGTWVAFAGALLVRTIYLRERAAERIEEKRRQAAEDQQIELESKARPNIAFEKVDFLPINFERYGMSVTSVVRVNGPGALVAIFRNEIQRTGHRVDGAEDTKARLLFVSRKDPSRQMTVNVAYWLGQRLPLNIWAGDVTSLVLYCERHKTSRPEVPETMHREMLYEELDTGVYDVLVTITATGSPLYVARFHLELDTEAPLETTLCKRAPADCCFCSEHRVGF